MQTFESLTVCAPRTSSWSTDIGWKLSPLIGSIFTLSFRSMHGFEATLLSQHPSASSQVLVVASPLQSLHPVCIPVATDDRLHPSAPPWCPIERNYGTKPMVQAGDQIFYTSQCGRRWFATCMKDGLEQAESHPLTLKSEATCQAFQYVCACFVVCQGRATLPTKLQATAVIVLCTVNARAGCFTPQTH